MKPIKISPGREYISVDGETYLITDLHSGVAIAAYDSNLKRGLAWVRSRPGKKINRKEGKDAQGQLERFLDPFSNPELFLVATPYQDGKNPLFNYVSRILKGLNRDIKGSDLTESLPARPRISHLDIAYKVNEIIVIYKDKEGPQRDPGAINKFKFP